MALHFCLRSRTRASVCDTTATVYRGAREPKSLPYRYHVETHPHRMYKFWEGDECYVRGKRPDQVFIVVDRFEHTSGFPHFILRDKSGRRWRVSQLQMAAKPIKEKK